jgi:hypothetical protein
MIIRTAAVTVTVEEVGLNGLLSTIGRGGDRQLHAISKRDVRFIPKSTIPSPAG